MFDDIAQKEENNKNGGLGAAPRTDAFREPEKKAVEDIFSETESDDGPADYPFKKVKPEIAAGAEAPPAPGGLFIRKIAAIAGIFIGLAAMGAAGYFGYGYVMENMIGGEENSGAAEAPPAGSVPDDIAGIPPDIPAGEDDFPPIPPVMNEPDSPEPPAAVAPPAPAEPKDSDGDGLTDEEELALGTDPFNADTDGDGLSDYQEVKIYQTDPLNPDTDGDGYTDGEEVANRFNPKGAGRLYGDINQ